MRASDRYLIIKSNSKFTGTNVKSSWKLIFTVIFEVNAHFMTKILLRPLLHEHRLTFTKTHQNLETLHKASKDKMLNFFFFSLLELEFANVSEGKMYTEKKFIRAGP